MLGLPNNWQRVKQWLNHTGNIYVSPIKSPTISLKNMELPVLKNYHERPQAAFWEVFPKSELPLLAKSGVIVKDLENMLLATQDRLSSSSLLRGKKTVENLSFTGLRLLVGFHCIIYG